MAAISEMTVSIAVDHRIRGQATVGLTFLKMAFKDLFKKPSGKGDLNFTIEIRLKDEPESSVRIRSTMGCDIKTDVEQIGNELYKLQQTCPRGAGIK